MATPEQQLSAEELILKRMKEGTFGLAPYVELKAATPAEPIAPYDKPVVVPPVKREPTTAPPVSKPSSTEGLSAEELILKRMKEGTFALPDYDKPKPLRDAPGYYAPSVAKAREKFVSEKGTDIYGRYTAEAGGAASERADAIAFAPRTVGGDIAPLTGESITGNRADRLMDIAAKKPKVEDLSFYDWMSLYASTPQGEREGFAGIASAFLPQTLMTKEETDAYKAYLKANPGFATDVANWANYIFTKQDPSSGETVERLGTYGLRMLGTVANLGVGVLEAPVREVGRQIQEARGIETYDPEDVIQRKRIDKAIAERQAKGEGIMGAGVDVGSQLAVETAGFATPFGPIIPVVNAASEAAGVGPIFDKEALRWIGGTAGGFAGLIGDFLTPITPPGTSAVTRTVGLSRAANTARAAKRVEDTAEALKPKLARDFGKIIQDIDNAGPAQSVDDIIENNLGALATRAEKGEDVSLLAYEDELRTFIKSRTPATEVATPTQKITVSPVRIVDGKVEQLVEDPLQKIRTLLDQFTTSIAKDEVAGKTGLFKLLLTPDEKLVRTGVIGLLPEKEIAAFNKRLRPILTKVSEAFDPSKIKAAPETGKEIRQLVLSVQKALIDAGEFSGEEAAAIVNYGLKRARLVEPAQAKNELLTFITEKLAAQQKGYTTIFDLQTRFEKARKLLEDASPNQIKGVFPRLLARAKEFGPATRAQIRMVAINESVFTPKEINSVMSTAFKSLKPTLSFKRNGRIYEITRPEYSPIVKQFTEELGGEWSTLNERLRREFADQVRANGRIAAFENVFLAQPNVSSVDTFAREFIAMILGRVETIEEALSSAGITAAQNTFAAAATRAESFMKMPEVFDILADITRKGRFELTDANKILAAVKAIAEKEKLTIKINMRSEDLLKVLVYKKMYDMQQTSLVRAFEKMAKLSPMLFPFDLAKASASKIAQAVAINLDGAAVSQAELSQITNAALENALKGSIAAFPGDEIKAIFNKYELPEDTLMYITSRLSEEPSVRQLRQTVGEDSQADVIRLATNLLSKDDLEPLFGETLAGMQRVNPYAAELFAVLEVAANIEGASEVIKALRQAEKVVQKGPANRLSNFAVDAVTNVLDIGSSFAKGSLLAGRFLPNLRFLTMNQMTAPFIIYSTLGAKYGLASLRELVFANPKVEKLLATMTPSVVVPPGAYGVIRPNLNQVAVRTPSRTYTYAELRDIVEKTPLMRSQARAEVTKDIIRDFVKQTRLVMKDAGPSQRNIFARGIQRFVTDNQNIWSEIANTADNRFRLGVFIRALEDGNSEQAAIKLAKESLFDYNNLNSFEKNYVNKVLWFWTFEKNNLSTTLKNMFENPARLKNIYLTRKYFDYDRENSPATKEYIETRIGRMIFEDKELLQRYSINGPSVPLLEGFYRMSDVMGFFLLLLNPEVRSTWDAPGKAIVNIADYAAGRMHPALATGMTFMFGVDPRSPAEDKKPTGFVDPKLMSLFYTFGMFEYAASTFFEAVERKDEIPGRQTFNGRQWKVRDSQKANYATLLNMATLIGVQRTARDYAPLIQMITSTKISPEDFEKFGTMRFKETVSPTVGGSLLQRLGSVTGVSTPIEEPSLALTRELNKRAAIRDLEDITRGKKE